MSLWDWFAEIQQKRAVQDGLFHRPPQERDIPDGLWHKCPACGNLTYVKELEDNLLVCPSCGLHNPVSAPKRIAQLVDEGSWEEWETQLESCDPLEFCDRKPYRDRLREMQAKTGLKDGVVVGRGTLENLPLVVGAMDFGFMGGSMGSVVGEKLTRAIERATSLQVPLVIVCASGGARMQEGILSLMQMAKTSAALARHRRAGLLYVPILTHPTTGGVTASFAMLGDIAIAEPKATIGFTGRRVIEQTLKQKIPEGFQSSEYLLAKGFIDCVVPRSQLRETLAKLLWFHRPSRHGSSPTPTPESHAEPHPEKLGLAIAEPENLGP
ncbi:MAG TPA: acetyl-CoA carboxylase carboxyl transferase subunit beta [Cyanobacteria bacterium UBA8156]|jgi:acetyl-CoA carboxylase carboxyl transferase subunit beta|nr:acetyl-CoA carboxylase carboxyl transferase subunit beta [Cyanobacteria bacterium UBA8156]